MWIKRVKISGWRSYSHDEPVVLDDCGPVNLLLGPNNVGKSNLQRFFHKLAIAAHGSSLHDPSFDWGSPRRIHLKLREREIDWRAEQKEVHAEIDYLRCGDRQDLIPNLVYDGHFSLVIRARVGGFDSRDIINPVYPTTRVRLLRATSENHYDPHLTVTHDDQPLPDTRPGELATPLRRYLDGLLAEAFIASVRVVEGQRSANEVVDADSPVRLMPGKIAEQMYHLKNDDTWRWSTIQDDVQGWLAELLGCEQPQIDFVTPGGSITPSAMLRLQSGARGRQPPPIQLSDFGAGVSEFLAILAFLRMRTTTEPMVLFIDEIEAHLHPTAVRKLVTIIRKNFPNVQLFISTHSTDLLDAMKENWRLYKFSMPQQWRTRVEAVSTTQDRLNLIAELGFRPTQLFLANSVVCVEGPSDVIYLRALIRQLEPNLVEGRDFSFLIYGGSNIRHVSYAGDGETLIQLLACAHHPIVVCDKDHADDDPLKPAVLRLRAEAESVGLRLFITPGYEVESVLENQALAAIVEGMLDDMRMHKSGKIDPTKLDANKSLRDSLAGAIMFAERPALSLEVANGLAKQRKVEIARKVTAAAAATFSPEGINFGKDICAAIKRASDPCPRD